MRVLDTLRAADVVACEDTRHTRLLLERHGIIRAHWSASTSTTNARARAELVERMRAGATVALVSDAGTPLVSDPGFALVRACSRGGRGRGAARVRARCWRRWSCRGCRPSAGASSASCRARAGELRALLAGAARRWWRSSRRGAWRGRWSCSPSRIPRGAVVVCRELTKLHEEVRRGVGRRAGRALPRDPRAGRDGAGGRRSTPRRSTRR